MAGLAVAVGLPAAHGDEVRLRSGRVLRGTVQGIGNEILVHTPEGDVRVATSEVVSVRGDGGSRRAPAPAPAAPLAPSVASARSTPPAVKDEVDRWRLILWERGTDRKEKAAAALTALGRPAVPYLIELYEVSGPPESSWLTWVLRDIGDPIAVDAFLAKLGSSDGELQASILESLGRFKDLRIFDVAVRFATQGKGAVRLRAFELIVRSGDPRAVPLLLRGVEDADGWIRECSEDALRSVIAKGGGASLITPLTTSLLLANDDAADSIVRLLAATRDVRTVEPIAEVLDRDNAKPRRSAVRALARLGLREATDPLERAIDDEDAVVRREAIVALDRLRDRRAFLAIVERLVDPEDDVRNAAHRALVSLAGCDQGNDREAWARWWARNGDL